MPDSAISSPVLSQPALSRTTCPTATDLRISTGLRSVEKSAMSTATDDPHHAFMFSTHPDLPTRGHKSSATLSIASSRKSRKRSLRVVLRRILRNAPSVPDRRSPTMSIHSIGSPIPSPPISLTKALDIRRPDDDQPRYPEKDNRAILHDSLPGTPQAMRFRTADLHDPSDLLGCRNSLPNRAGLAPDQNLNDPADESPVDRNLHHESHVGTALVSGATTPRRRSRSVSGMRSTAEIIYTYRQLEDEKTYWRQSVAHDALLRAKSEDSRRAESFKDAYSQRDHSQQPEDAGDDADVEADARRYVAVVAADDEVDARLDEHEHRLLTAHDSPVMGPRNVADTPVENLQTRLVRLEQMMSAFQHPIESLVRNKRKSVTFDTTDSRRSSRNPMPDDSRMLFFLQLINDERAKRRSLERQVRALREDLAEMRFQLSQPIMSRGSRSYTPGQPRQRYAPSHHSRGSSGGGLSIYDNQRLASRFSQSESLTGSEAARMRQAELDDAQSQHNDAEVVSAPITPYEISTDPIRRWKPRESGELDMF